MVFKNLFCSALILTTVIATFGEFYRGGSSYQPVLLLNAENPDEFKSLDGLIASGAAGYSMFNRTAQSGADYTNIIGPFIINEEKAGIAYRNMMPSAIDKKGFTDNRLNTISAELPAPWKHKDLGSVLVKGHTTYDATYFKLEGSGTCEDSTADQFQYAYFPISTEGEITVRYVPQPGSQFALTGLMMRETLESNSPLSSLMISTDKPAKSGAPKWQVVRLARGIKGKRLQVKNTLGDLGEPVVISGNLTGAIWLRMQRKFNSFMAYTSIDGKTWTSMGSTFVEMKKNFFAGIAVCSGLKKKSATVMFDNITIPGWSSVE